MEDVREERQNPLFFGKVCLVLFLASAGEQVFHFAIFVVFCVAQFASLPPGWRHPKNFSQKYFIAP
jgi:hypothetical protein